MKKLIVGVALYAATLFPGHAMAEEWNPAPPDDVKGIIQYQDNTEVIVWFDVNGDQMIERQQEIWHLYPNGKMLRCKEHCELDESGKLEEYIKGEQGI